MDAHEVRNRLSFEGALRQMQGHLVAGHFGNGGVSEIVIERDRIDAACID
jgi:hypothetical protein